MSVIKRIISFVLVIAILICFAVPFAHAAAEYKSTYINYAELVLHNAYYYGNRVFDDSPFSGLGRFLKGTSTALLVNDVCTESYDSYHACSDVMTFDESAIGWDDYGKYYLLQCNYCDKWFRCYSSDIFDAYDEYVNSLTTPEVSSNGLFTVYPTGWHFDWSNVAHPYLNNSAMTSYNGGFEVNGTVLVSDQPALYDPGIIGRMFIRSAPFTLPDGLYRVELRDNYYGNISYGMTYISAGIDFFGSYDGESWVRLAGIGYSDYKYNDSPAEYSPYIFSSMDYGYKYYRFELCCNHMSMAAGGIASVKRECFIDCIEAPDGSWNGSATPPETRPVSLMQTINNYNNDNSYTDNSTTNYFIGIVDDNGEVTDVYNPTVYDETTKIFTEPVTGAQYQTSGWTYNYLSRTYDIALADNTFLIGATPVSRIELTYGDEAVTLVYYDANNNILGHDDYAYVAVAKDECTLYGHSYTYEIIKDATCTEMGERKYTCSRCGNEYAEDIPKDEHTLTVKEHINTKYDSDGNVLEVGYTLYECDVCGEQKRENDDASEVDDSWLNWLGTQFRKLGSGLVGGLADGIEYLTGTVIKSVTDWSLGLVEWLFGLVDGNLLNTWYSWFNEDNPYINQELEKDGTEVDSIWA